METLCSIWNTAWPGLHPIRAARLREEKRECEEGGRRQGEPQFGEGQSLTGLVDVREKETDGKPHYGSWEDGVHCGGEGGYSWYHFGLSQGGGRGCQDVRVCDRA